MKIRMKRLTALLAAASLCAGTVYAENSMEEIQSEQPQTVTALTETLPEARMMQPPEASAETPSETPTEVPSENQTQTPSEAVTEETAETLTEKYTEDSAETLTEKHTEDSAETLTEKHTEGLAETLTEKHTEGSAETLTEKYTEGSAETLTEKHTEDSAETITEKQTETDGTKYPEETKTDKEKKESEKKEKAQKKREPVIVKDETGTVCSMKEIVGPTKLTCGGLTYPVDYEEGVYLVQIPEDTQKLQIMVLDQEEDEKVSLTRWNGYLAELEKTWFLCPDDPIEGAFTTEGNVYSVNLEKYMLDPEQMTLEQLAVYGAMDEEISYAEIFVYSEERSEVLLVEVVSDETQTEDMSETGNEAVSEEMTEVTTEAFSEEGTEPVSESELYLKLLEEVEAEATLFSARPSDIQDSYSAAGKNLAESAEKYTPAVQSVNGEWQILGLVRSGQKVDEKLYRKYLENVVNTVTEKKGVLHKKKYTEYSRVVLALTSLGEDVTDVGGYNLLEPLADFDQTVWQGVNGAIFALLAFDSHDYEIPAAAEGKTQTTRAKLINHILSQEVSGGGWDLSGRNADPDMTAMAIQALAPYYNENTAVKHAVDRALVKLSSMQNQDGGYGSYNIANSESCSQVIVALTALGIDPNTDPRFSKNGKSVVDALLTFRKKDGSFSHESGGGSDQMSTEQAYYALTAYQRFQNGQTSLYDMSDVILASDYKKVEETENLIKALPAVITLADRGQVQKALSSYQTLSELQKSLITQEIYDKLQAAVTALSEMDVEMESEEQTETGGEEETEPITEKDPNAETGSDGKENTSGTNKNPSGTNKDTDKNSDTNKASGIDKKPTGTTKKVNLVSGSNRTGAASAGTSGGKVTASKTAETGTEAETELETETEKRSGKKSGSTQISQAAKDVIEEIGSLFGTSKTARNLPEEASEYTDVQIDSILEIYRNFEELEETEKEAVRQNKKYEEYLNVLNKLNAANHYDGVTDTDLRENEEEVLPWYIQMEAASMLIEENSAKAVREALKGQGALLKMTDINLTDLLHGGSWQPEDMVRVRLAETGKDSFENLAVVHMKDDGSMEFIKAYISGNYVEFDTDHFSRFGIVGYNGSMEELMEEQEEEIVWIYLLPGAGAAVLLLLLLMIRSAGSGKKKGVKNSER